MKTMKSLHWIGWVIALLLLATPVTPLNAQTEWTSLGGPSKTRDLRDISVSANGSTLYGAETFLYKSTNGGTSWSTTGVLLTEPLVVTSKHDNSDIVLAGTEGVVYRNTAGGVSGSWNPVLTVTGLTPLRLTTSTLNSQNMYLGAAYLDGNTRPIRRSENGGQDWSTVTFNQTEQTNIYDVAPWPGTGTILDDYVWAGGSDPQGAAEGTSVPGRRGMWISSNFGANWDRLGPAGGMDKYDVRAVTIEATGTTSYVLYAGTSTGKVYTSTNGTTWTQSTSLGGSVTSIHSLDVIDLGGAIGVIAGTNAGVYRSWDDGGTWELVLSAADGIKSLAVPKDVLSSIYAAAPSAAWKSTDWGANWENISTGLGRMPVSSVAANGTSTWTVSDVYESLGRYDGSNWSTTEILDFRGEHVMRNSSSGYLFASGLSIPTNPKAALYRSTDGGSTYGTWYLSSQASGNGFNGSLVDPANSANTYVWGKDGSTNLRKVTSQGAGDPTTVGSGSYAVNDMLYVTSGGKTYFAKENEGVYKCDNGPCSGTQVLSGVTVRSLGWNPSVSTSTVYAAGPTGLRRYDGSNWAIKRTDNLARVIMRPGYPSSSEYVAVLAGDGNHIYYTPDGSAATPVWVDGALDLPTPIYDIRTDPGSSSVVYAATDQGVYKIVTPTSAPTLASPAHQSTGQPLNVTLTWNALSGAGLYHLLVDNNSDFSSPVFNNAAITGTSFQASGLTYNTVYYWKVAGINLVGEGPASGVNSFTTTPGIGLAVSAATTNGSACNTKVSNCYPKLSWTLYGITITDSTPLNVYRYACTYGQGDCGGSPSLVYTTTNSGTTWWVDQAVTMPKFGQTPATTYFYTVTCSGSTSNKVSVNSINSWKLQVGDDEGGMPLVTALEMNYPNPFNPVTTIRYAVAEGSHVKLVIYDLLGREIKVLVDEFQAPGQRSVEFDANSLPSGVYFYRMSAGTFSDIRKMILIR